MVVEFYEYILYQMVAPLLLAKGTTISLGRQVHLVESLRPLQPKNKLNGKDSKSIAILPSSLQV